MEGRRIRIGDVIDDYCTRCRLIMNHGVVGMVGDEVRKVRCNTCLSEHVYKHGRLPKRRRGETSKLFDEVLKGIRGDSSAAAPEPEPASSEEGAAAGPEAAAGKPDAETPPAAEDGAPQPPPAEPSADEVAHGVRRKLYTIRRHSGGKPPGSGSQGR